MKTSLVRAVALVVALAMLSGCASLRESQARDLSVGSIGCASDDITVSEVSANYVTGLMTWNAECKGQTFVCSGTTVEANCEKRLEDESGE